MHRLLCSFFFNTWPEWKVILGDIQTFTSDWQCQTEKDHLLLWLAYIQHHIFVPGFSFLKEKARKLWSVFLTLDRLILRTSQMILCIFFWFQSVEVIPVLTCVFITHCLSGMLTTTTNMLRVEKNPYFFFYVKAICRLQTHRWRQYKNSTEDFNILECDIT